MAASLVYFDSSALVKLVAEERETPALTVASDEWPDWVSSELAGVEVRRAGRRVGGERGLRRAVELVERLQLVPIDKLVLAAAVSVDPFGLGSLDAIHLATAISLGSDLDAMIAYDAGLVRAARAAGLTVLSPA